MARQIFKLAILYIDGTQVEIAPGNKGGPGLKIETDLIKDVRSRVGKRNVGIGTTQNQVLDIVDEELTAVFTDLKNKTLEVI